MTRRTKNGQPCPRCGSTETPSMGYRVIDGGEKIHRYHCQRCGKTFSQSYVLAGD